MVTQRTPVNDEEGEALTQVSNLFYRAFGEMVGKHLSMVPESLRDHMLSMLSDGSSVYGTYYEPHITDCPLDVTGWEEQLFNIPAVRP